jgi:uncharacterized protein (TIGR02145 family)
MKKFFTVSLLLSFFFFGGCKKEKEVIPPTLPVISTSALSNITTTSATGGGNVTSDGGAEITVRGICWGTESNPTAAFSRTSNGNGTGEFVSNIIGISAGTLYHVRAYATNSVGTAYGADITFTTLGQSPSATTLAATDITASGSTLNGTVNPKYVSTTITFEYGLTEDYGQVATATQSPATGNTETNVNVVLSELSSGTVYHYRIKAVNSVGTSYGNDFTFRTIVSDIDGNDYNTVTIGIQVWMTENLRTTRYADGTAIPYINTDAEWGALSATNRAYCWYENIEANKITFGGLYNWAAVMNGAAGTMSNPSHVQGVCPTGWHVPSENEWIQMLDYLMSNQYNFDGTTQENRVAKSLASPSDWAFSSVVGSAGSTDHPEMQNLSGFTALPRGYRNELGAFDYSGETAYWWSTSDPYGTGATYWAISYNDFILSWTTGTKNSGMSVRCVKD